MRGCMLRVRGRGGRGEEGKKGREAKELIGRGVDGYRKVVGERRGGEGGERRGGSSPVEKEIGEGRDS